MARVAIVDTAVGLRDAIDAVFAAFGGVRAALQQRGGTVYVKPNAVHFAPHTHTDPRLLDALLGYLRDHGYRQLAVMESCTAGLFTRLVFRATGYDRICRRHDARPVYLDEGATVPVTLPGEETPIRVPRPLRDAIIERGDNVYLSVPKLKTHFMAKVTLGVKNQMAFVTHADRMERHSGATLHARVASLFALTRPDFCLIEGLTATAHGHLPPTALLDECLVPLDILIGSPDTLAADVVGARVLGYDVAEVEHLRLCAAAGLGEGELARIELVGAPLERFSRKLPHALLRRLHPEVRIVVGRRRACVEGCRGVSECFLEMLTNDCKGRGGWTLVFGSGFEPGDLDDLPGDILLVGPCAVDELGSVLPRRYPGRRIDHVPAHADVMLTAHHMARLCGVAPLAILPVNPVVAGLLLVQARLHGLTARVPPLRG